MPYESAIIRKQIVEFEWVAQPVSEREWERRENANKEHSRAFIASPAIQVTSQVSSIAYTVLRSDLVRLGKQSLLAWPYKIFSTAQYLHYSHFQNIWKSTEARNFEIARMIANYNSTLVMHRCISVNTNLNKTFIVTLLLFILEGI